MKLSDKTIEEVKNRMDIVEVISDFVNLKKTGSTFKALSPFSNEKTPSFYVVPHKSFFKDFSSGKGGDAITFLMEHEGVSYVESIVYLANKYGIPIETEKQNEGQQQIRTEKESVFVALNFAAKHFQWNLWETETGQAIGLSYFKERGFPDHIVKKFELGYAPESWDNLLKASKKQKQDPAILEKAGLIKKQETKEDYFDFFRDRVMFTIHNLAGKAVAFSGRVLKKDKKPKYINSPETEVYQKSKILYGLTQAKNAIRTQDNCYLVEGYTDVISMHLAGVENVVASSGTALTEEQIKEIARFTRNITVLFDGDVAGFRASLRGIDMILEQGINVKVVVLPEGEDPDSFARKSKEHEFQNYLNNKPQDIITFKARLVDNDTKKDPIKRAEIIKGIVRTISLIPDPIKRAVYTQETSLLLGVDESVLISEQNKLLLTRAREKQKRLDRQEEDLPSNLIQPPEELKSKVSFEELVMIQEKECIRLLLNYGFHEIKEEYPLYQYIINELDELQLLTPVYKRLLEEYKKQLAKQNIPDTQYFIQNYDGDDIKSAVIDLCTDRWELSKNWELKYQIFVPHESDILGSAVYSNLIRLKHRLIQKIMKENMDKLKSVGETEAQNNISQNYCELKLKEMELAALLGIVVPSQF